ncbi:MAG: hypothetical protein Q9221_008842 [Calogaya cf. arnoldii]
MGKKRKIDVNASRNNFNGSPPTPRASAIRIISERKFQEDGHLHPPVLDFDIINTTKSDANRPTEGSTSRPIEFRVPQGSETVRQPPSSIACRHIMTVQLDDAVTIYLDDSTLTIIGQYEIWVRKGAISILGAVLYPSYAAFRVFAPSTHSLPVIRPIRNPFGPAGQPVEIIITSFRSGIRLLRQVSPKFGRIWNKTLEVSDDVARGSDGNKPSLACTKQTYSILKTSNDDGCVSKHKLRSLESPNGWQALLTSLTSRNNRKPPTAALVCGPKGSGKSTLVRMLMNSINDARGSRCIALLDIDPGQPEFSPPGEISLVQISSYHFAPPFCHPSASTQGLALIRSHHIGATSPQDDPQHYLQCVLELFKHYKQLLVHKPSCPLIVNTAGWIQGKGLEILFDLIHQLDLTDVIYTSTTGPSEAVDAITQATTARSIRLHLLASQPVEAVPRSTADLRMMQTLSYFHLDEPEMGHLRWDPTPIEEMVTERIHYAGPEQSIYAVQLLGPELDPEFLIQVLEGCIVGIVVVENDAALPFGLFPSLPRTPEQIPYIPPTAQITPPLSPFDSHSLGQGLIRSIDTTSHTFHLITPIPHSTFASVCTQQRKIVLVRGSLDTPAWAYKEDLYKQMYHRKQMAKEGLADEGTKGWTKEDTETWVEGRGWMSTDGRKKGERVRRARRDLK